MRPVIRRPVMMMTVPRRAIAVPVIVPVLLPAPPPMILPVPATVLTPVFPPMFAFMCALVRSAMGTPLIPIVPTRPEVTATVIAATIAMGAVMFAAVITPVLDAMPALATVAVALVGHRRWRQRQSQRQQQGQPHAQLAHHLPPWSWRADARPSRTE